MTYRELIQNLKDIAMGVENAVIKSQVVSLDDPVAYADTILFFIEDEISELFDNVTGDHGHVIEVK